MYSYLPNSCEFHSEGTEIVAWELREVIWITKEVKPGLSGGDMFTVIMVDALLAYCLFSVWSVWKKEEALVQ
jgi:uncharacterized membrane protein